MEASSRIANASVLCLHDIRDGRLPPSTEHDDSYYNIEKRGPSWPERDGIKILGTPLGSPIFVEENLNNKLKKHRVILLFIVDIAKMGFPSVEHKMLTGYAVPRLTHILKSVPKDSASIEWIESTDEAHLCTWLSCSGAETLHALLPPILRPYSRSTSPSSLSAPRADPYSKGPLRFLLP